MVTDAMATLSGNAYGVLIALGAVVAFSSVATTYRIRGIR
jgi:hypothetical protein